MDMTITRYQKAWLKMSQYNEDRIVKCDSTSAKDEVSLLNSSCDTEKERSEDTENELIQENNSHSGTHKRGDKCVSRNKGTEINARPGKCGGCCLERRARAEVIKIQRERRGARETHSLKNADGWSSQNTEEIRVRGGTYLLESAEGRKGQDTKTIQAGERHLLPGESRRRDTSGHRNDLSERGHSPTRKRRATD
jgi:hypothetical protein